MKVNSLNIYYQILSIVFFSRFLFVVYNSELFYFFFFQFINISLVFSTFGVSIFVICFKSKFFIILFQGSHIFSSFTKFAFFHPFSDIPMNKSSFGIHQIIFHIQIAPCFGNCSSVRQHTDSSFDLSTITKWHGCRCLIVYADFESSWTPVNKLNGPFQLKFKVSIRPGICSPQSLLSYLDIWYSSIDIFWYNISPIKQATRHVFTWISIHSRVSESTFTLTRFTFDHLISTHKTRWGQFCNLFWFEKILMFPIIFGVVSNRTR